MSDEQLRIAREARIAELEAERAEALAIADIRAGQIEYLRRIVDLDEHEGKDPA